MFASWVWTGKKWFALVEGAAGAKIQGREAILYTLNVFESRRCQESLLNFTLMHLSWTQSLVCILMLSSDPTPQSLADETGSLCLRSGATSWQLCSCAAIFVQGSARAIRSLKAFGPDAFMMIGEWEWGGVVVDSNDKTCNSCECN